MQPTLFPVPVGVGMFMMFGSTVFLAAGVGLWGDKKYFLSCTCLLVACLGYVASVGWAFVIGAGA